LFDISVFSDLIPDPAYRADCIWCAVLLVLPPLGQADISPFGKNLLQSATPALAPCTKDRWPSLLPGPVITLALFLFRRIKLFFFISPILLFRYSGLLNVRHQSHHLIAPVIQSPNQQN
jgi:hypothetical protein